MNNSKSLKEIISENRSFIMTVAIIWIGLFHFPIDINIPGIHFIKSVGYGGVDLFIFLSGFGLYHSLGGLYTNKDGSSKLNLSMYAKKRALRILPSYFPFLIIWIIEKRLFDQMYVTEIFGNITMTGWWNGDQNQFNWYIDLIVLLYLLAPYVFLIIKENKKPLLSYLFLMCLGLFIGISFFHGQLIQAMSRFPVFITGMLFADLDDDHWESCPKAIYKMLSSKIFWILLSIIGIGLMYLCLHQSYLDLWHYGLYWYPFLLIAPGLSILLGLLGSRLPKWFGGLGDASFEIFLWHIGIYEFLLYRTGRNVFMWIMIFLIGFIVGYGYHKLIVKIMKGKRLS